MSRKTQLLIGFILLLGGLTQAQIPLSISIEKNTNGHNAQLACTPGQENYAGSASIGSSTASSNDIDLDTTFLCMNDIVNIVHNGDQMLLGDPDPSTPPGVCYGFYNCLPTISGPTDISTIGSDPCLVPNPIPGGSPEFLVFIEGNNLNGDLTLNNTGDLQTNFNGGNPFLIYLSPLTFDELLDLGGGIFTPNYESNGPCAHSNIDSAFAVVYLNEISVQNIDIGPQSDLGNCSASFDLFGGLPQFDSNETYSVSASLSSDPSVTASINTTPAGHGDEIIISVPQAGVYNVEVTDGKACPLSFTLDMSSCTQTVTLSIDDQVVLENETACFPIVVENFNDIVSFQFVISYDPNVANLAPGAGALINPNPNLGIAQPPTGFLITEGVYSILWFDFMSNPTSIPDGEVLFEVCLTAVGDLGDQTPVDIVGTQALPIEFGQLNGGDDIVSVIVDPGTLEISSPNLNLDITTTDLTCFDLDNGTVSVLASGGNSPYEFVCENLAGTFSDQVTIVDPSIPYQLNNLQPDTFLITATENAGAGPLTVTDTFIIENGPELSIIISIPNFNICFGENGDISATPAVNGTSVPSPYPSNYIIEWSNGADQFELSDVPAGVNYSVTLTDTDLMCSATSTDLLPQAPQIQFNTTTTNATCSGVADGGLQITVSGGTGSTYSIELQDELGNPIANNTGTEIIANNLLEGDYIVIAEDENNCVNSETISVGASTSLQLSISGVPADIECFGDCDASLAVSAQTIGGISNNYTFDWTDVNGLPISSTDLTAQTEVTGLCAGIYNLSLTDDQGCSTNETYEITEPTELIASIDQSLTVNAQCNTGTGGSITVVVGGGTPTYSYDWGALGQTDSIAVNLMQGTYTVTVTDNNNCEVILTEDIIQPTPPLINSVLGSTLECNGDSDGTITADAIATDNPIALYSWSTGNSGISLTTETNLTAGTYTVTVSDTDGCTAVASGEIIEPDSLLIANFDQFPPTCPGDNNGEIAVQVTGGSGSYNYNWSNNNMNAVNFGLSAGDYTVTITDAINNCPEIEGSVTLEDPLSINAIIFDTVAVSCAGAVGIDCDGSATASAEYTDGTINPNFTFNWSSGETTTTANSLCEGLNSLIVFDGVCSDTFAFEIGAPEPLISTVDITDVSCTGFSDGSATAQGIGGTSPYTYTWVGNVISQTLTDLAAGSYEVTIEDDKGCSVTNVAFVGEPSDPLSASIDASTSSQNVSCFGEADGFVSIAATGGNVSQGNLQYIWGQGITAEINSSSAYGLNSGSFEVTVVDNQGCEFPLTFNIGSPDPITFNIPAIDDILCPGGTTTVTVDNATGGNGASNLFYTFSIDGGAPQTLGTSIEVFPGQHIITVTDISDAGCSSDTTFVIEGLTESVLTYPNPVEIELGGSLTVGPSIAAFNNPLNPDSIFWSPSEFLEFGNDPLEPTITPLDNTVYLVEALDINGCYISAELIVEVDKNRNIYIPNIFTPNGDGFNSIFQPIAGVGVKQMNYFRVYDRWGAMLHERLNVDGNDLTFENPTVAWDGKFRGNEVDQGVYVYLAEIEFLDGRVLLYRGDVTLAK